MPSAVDTGFAQWLKDPALFVTLDNTALPAAVLAAGVDSEIISPLYWDYDAAAEAARQMSVLEGPLAIDEHVVKGARRDLIGQVIVLTNPLLGYAKGQNCFVIDADEKEAGYTVLQVVVRVGAWTPADLYRGGVQGAYFDVSDLSSMFQDTAGTTPAAVDSIVRRILDKSGNGNHFTSAASGNSPFLRSDGGSLYWLEFDGTNDQLNGPVAISGDKLYSWVGFRPISYGDSDRVLSLASGTAFDWDSNARVAPILMRSPNNLGAYRQGDLNSSPFTTGQDLVVHSFFNGAVHQLRMNGIFSATTASTGSFTIDKGGIGDQANPDGEAANMRFFGGGFVAKVLTAGEANRLETWQGSKMGLRL